MQCLAVSDFSPATTRTFPTNRLRLNRAFPLRFRGLVGHGCAGRPRARKAIGVVLFSLALPISCLHLFLIRAVIASAESIVLGLASALLIPALALLVDETYPFRQALVFGLWMSGAGLVILTFGLLLLIEFVALITSNTQDWAHEMCQSTTACADCNLPLILHCATFTAGAVVKTRDF